MALARFVRLCFANIDVADGLCSFLPKPLHAPVEEDFEDDDDDALESAYASVSCSLFLVMFWTSHVWLIAKALNIFYFYFVFILSLLHNAAIKDFKDSSVRQETRLCAPESRGGHASVSS